MSLVRRFHQEGFWTLYDGDQAVVTMKEETGERAITLKISGALRSDTELDFRDELMALVSVGSHVILDCAEITYMSNSCQFALLDVQQQMDQTGKGSLKLIHVPQNLYADFEKTNLSGLLDIE